MLGFFQSKLQ